MTAGTFTALLDANVLYPAALRDLLMTLAVKGLYRARWTDAIHDEWTRNLLTARPDLSPERVARVRHLMDQAVLDARVTGYEELIGGLRLPDPDDRHVLAAAIRVKADVIVTMNLRDFPAEVLDPFEIQAVHPDDFMLGQFDRSPGTVFEAVKEQRARLRNPPRTVDEHLNFLLQGGLTGTVARLRDHASLL